MDLHDQVTKIEQRLKTNKHSFYNNKIIIIMSRKQRVLGGEGSEESFTHSHR